ncbi:hypothetical protein BofuT4_P067850.1 [Botrytis cinerea T4]|uniref:Uncharacterized protein n=1 Tax=Botryotinia fuckeliana (strain T4) TaxID=999810 RepID=G2XRK9_BOTF4|nr:hypothetical protein BofuT4_P067850.1 [Botrytis cinerea T4]
MSSAIAGQPKHRQAHKLKRQPRLSNSQFPPQTHTPRYSLIRTLFVGQGYRRHSTKFETCSSTSTTTFSPNVNLGVL